MAIPKLLQRHDDSGPDADLPDEVQCWGNKVFFSFFHTDSDALVPWGVSFFFVARQATAEDIVKSIRMLHMSYKQEIDDDFSPPRS